MSQMSQCLRASSPLSQVRRLNVSDVSVSQGLLPPLTGTPSQCLRCLSVSGPPPPPSHRYAVSMSQMSQCLRAPSSPLSQVRRLNVSDVSVSQGPLLPPLTGTPSQCLRCLSVSGPPPPPSHRYAVSMSQMSQCLRAPPPSQCLRRLNVSNVSVSHGFIPSSPSPRRRRLNVSNVSVSHGFTPPSPSPRRRRLNVSDVSVSHRRNPRRGTVGAAAL